MDNESEITDDESDRQSVTSDGSEEYDRQSEMTDVEEENDRDVDRDDIKHMRGFGNI